MLDSHAQQFTVSQIILKSGLSSVTLASIIALIYFARYCHYDNYSPIGFVMSDWRAAHSTSIIQGLDQQMPGDTFFGEALIQDVQSGSIPEAAVDQSVVRILNSLFEVSCRRLGGLTVAG